MDQAIANAIAAITASGEAHYAKRVADDAKIRADRRVQFLKSIAAENEYKGAAGGSIGGMRTFSYLDSSANHRHSRAYSLMQARSCQIKGMSAKVWLEKAMPQRRAEMRCRCAEQAAFNLAALDANLIEIARPVARELDSAVAA